MLRREPRRIDPERLPAAGAWMTAKLSRQAQRMLSDIGFESIENDDITIGPVKILLSRRAIDQLNCQAIELAGQFPLRTQPAEVKRLQAKVKELRENTSGYDDQDAEP
jgi:hypothetical protein